MRRLLISLGLSVALMSSALRAEAAPEVAITGEAEVGDLHRGPCQGASVVANGRPVWCGASEAEVVTDVAWARGRHALAFATRSRDGNLALRVAVVRGRFRGTLITWPLAVRGRASLPLAVMWLGHDRIGIGRNAVRPLLVASWRLRNA